MMYIAVGNGIVTGGGGGGAAARVVSAPLPPPAAPRPPPPPPPPPPRPNGWGMAKPVGTTIDGVPVMFVTDVFSRGVSTTSYFENRSHVWFIAAMRTRLALT